MFKSFDRRNPLTRYWGLILAGFLLLGLTNFLLTEHQNRKKEEEQLRTKARNEIWPSIQENIKTTIAEFDLIAADRPLREKDFQSLQDALSRIHELSREYPKVYFEGSHALRDSLETRLNTFLTDILWTRSINLEREAKSLFDSGKEEANLISDSIEKMKLAARLQRRINDDFSENPRTSFPRIAELEAWISYVEATPLQMQIDKLTVVGNEAVQNENWEEALEVFSKIRSIQNTINIEYPEAPQANITESVRIEDVINSARAHILLNESVDEEKQARVYLQTDDSSHAIEHFQNALRLQNEINVDYAGTKVFSLDRSRQLSQTIQNMGSVAAVSKLIQMDQELDLLLSVKMAEKAAYKLEDIITHYRSIKDDFPLAEDVPGEISKKAEYLSSILGRLPRIYEIVETVTDKELAQKMYVSRSLVSQELYRLVSGQNPSRTVGAALPVDSVDYEEASDFCMKLSWIMVQEIKIPDWDTLAVKPDLFFDSNYREWTDPGGEGLKSPVFNPKTHVASTEPPMDCYQELSTRSRSISFRWFSSR